MTPPRALLIVASPLQAIAAAEAIDAYGLDVDETALWVLINDEPGTIDQMTATLELLPLPAAQIHCFSSRHGSVRKARWLLRASRELGTVETVYVGDYRLPSLRHIANHPRIPRTVVLDDGNGTALLHRARSSGHHYTVLAHTGVAAYPASSRRILAYRLSPFRLRDRTALEFFTIYPLEPSGADRVRRHAFDWLRRTYGPLQPDGTSMIIGSNMVEEGILSFSAYREAVQTAIHHAATDIVIYAPHRREAAAKVAALGLPNNTSVRGSSLPIELSVATSGRFPSSVHTIASSAADTLAVLSSGRISVRTMPLSSSGANPAAIDNIRYLQAVSSSLRGSIARGRSC